MQELEKEKNQKATESDAQGGDADKPNIKFMISGEAPVLMSKACELLIKDLSFRAWRHTERNRRRTLQRQDLHAAVGESEVYDFLIDIVPRVTTQKSAVHQPDAAATMTTTIPAGLSLGGLPPGLPTVPPPSMTSPPAMPSMESSMIQQMQQQQQQQQQQHFQDPQQYQQQFQTYLGMPQHNTADMTQVGIQMNSGNVQHSQQNQQAHAWMSQQMQNTGNNAPS